MRRPGVNNSRHFSTARNLSGQKSLRWVISQFLYITESLFVTVRKLKFLTVDPGAFCNLLENQPMFTFCCKQKLALLQRRKWEKHGSINNWNFVEMDIIYIQLFRDRLSEEMRTRQSRKVIWDMINTLFVTTEAVEPTLVAFLSHSQTYVRGLPYHSFQFFWRKVPSKPPTIPFRIVACTFSDNLSRNSCISFLH